MVLQGRQKAVCESRPVIYSHVVDASGQCTSIYTINIRLYFGFQLLWQFGKFFVNPTYVCTFYIHFHTEVLYFITKICTTTDWVNSEVNDWLSLLCLTLLTPCLSFPWSFQSIIPMHSMLTYYALQDELLCCYLSCIAN